MGDKFVIPVFKVIYYIDDYYVNMCDFLIVLYPKVSTIDFLSFRESIIAKVPILDSLYSLWGFDPPGKVFADDLW